MGRVYSVVLEASSCLTERISATCETFMVPARRGKTFFATAVCAANRCVMGPEDVDGAESKKDDNAGAIAGHGMKQIRLPYS